MIRSAVFTALLLCVSIAVAGPRTAADLRIERTGELVYEGGSTGAAKADTLFIYGGPGTLEGKFETAGGLPDRQGWIGVDRTLDLDNAWHVDPFLASGLDPSTPGNVAWWCGEVLTSCGAGDPPEGYGNSYDASIEWSESAGDPGLPTTFRAHATLTHDTEPG